MIFVVIGGGSPPPLHQYRSELFQWSPRPNHLMLRWGGILVLLLRAAYCKLMERRLIAA